MYSIWCTYLFLLPYFVGKKEHTSNGSKVFFFFAILHSIVLAKKFYGIFVSSKQNTFKDFIWVISKQIFIEDFPVLHSFSFLHMFFESFRLSFYFLLPLYIAFLSCYRAKIFETADFYKKSRYLKAFFVVF